jgi:hypothetical protein
MALEEFISGNYQSPVKTDKLQADDVCKSSEQIFDVIADAAFRGEDSFTVTIDRGLVERLISGDQK